MASVEISINARDNASAALDSVRGKLQIFDQFGRQASDLTEKFDRVERSIGGFDISVSKATRAVRGLAVPLISELSPALGQTAGGMAQVITSAALLGSGFGVVAIAAAGLAGIIGGQLITAWREHNAKIEEFKTAQRSLNFDVVSQGLAKERSEVTKLTDEYDELKQTLLELRAARDPRTGEQLGYGIPRADDTRLGEARARLEARAQRQQAFIEGRRASEFTRAEGEDLGQGTLTDTASFEARRRLADLRKRVIEVGILDPIEREFQAALREAETVRQQVGGGAEQAQIADRLVALARANRQQALRARGLGFQAIPIEGIEDVGRFEALAAGIEPPALQVEGIRQRLFEIERRAFEGREAAPEPGIADAADFEALGYGIEPPESAVGRARRAIADADLRDSERLLQMDRDRLLLQTQRTDLSLEQRNALEAEAIQADYLLKIEQARLDPAKELSAEIEKQIRLQQLQERTEALPGLRRGLADIETEFGSIGLRMQSWASSTAGGMARAFDDGLFDVLTGNFKDLPEVARRFTADMVRAITGELSKMVTGQIFGQFRSFLGGGAAESVPFASGGRLFGAGAGGGPVLTADGRPLSESEIATAYAAAGEAGVRALRSGDAAVIGGEFVQAGAGLEQVSGGAGVTVTPASRFNLRSGAGIAGSAALLGLTAYGATGAQTNFDIGTSAAAGALSGAALGAQLGGLAGYQGAGAGVGALAGAAIAGTLAFLAKQEADKERAKARQALELERAAGAGTDLVRSAAGARSVSDLFRRITAFGSGYTGGTANPAVSTTVQTPTGPRPIGIENPTYPVATLADLLAAPETLRANIQAGVDPASLVGPNAAASQALQDIATELVARFREAEQGVGLMQEDRVGGLTRRTTYPASRADMLDPTLDVTIDELTLQALSDDDRAILLMDVMGRVAVEQDIQSAISDGATGQIVSITRIARSTIGLPPVVPPGVPAAAVPAIGAAVSLNIPQFTEPPPQGAPIFGPVMISTGGEFPQMVESGETQPTGRFAAPTAEQVAAYEARRAEFYRPYLEQLATTAKEQLAALTPFQIQGALAAGLLTPEGVAALVQAGLLPNITAVLPAQVLEQILATGGDGATGAASAGVPGGGFGVPGFSPSFSAATIAALNAAISSATFGLSTTVGLTSPSNLSATQAVVAQLAGIAGLLAGIPGFGTAAAAALGFANSLNAQITSAQLAMASGHDPANPDALASLISNAPMTTGLAALAAAIANGQAFVSFTAAEASALGIQGPVDAQGNVIGQIGYVAGTPTVTGATGAAAAGYGAGEVGGGGSAGEGSSFGESGAGTGASPEAP